MNEDDDIFGPAPSEPLSEPSLADALAPAASSEPTSEPVPASEPQHPTTVPPMSPTSEPVLEPDDPMQLLPTPGPEAASIPPIVDTPVTPLAEPPQAPSVPSSPETKTAAGVPESAQAGSGAADATLRALFAELGRDNYDMMTDAQRHEMAVHVAKTFGAMADAIRQMLETRADVKRALGVTATELGIGANPLKFARTKKAALDGLIQPLSDGILHGEEAVDDSLHAMQAHQYAMISGIKAALQTALKEFDPLLIEKHLEQGTVGKLVPGSRKRALWDSFTENYARFREQAEENFRVVIGRELDKLYHTQRPRGDDPQ
jgi:type VI secretion system protein ImpI/type VI secretion system protein